MNGAPLRCQDSSANDRCGSRHPLLAATVTKIRKNSATRGFTAITCLRRPRPSQKRRPVVKKIFSSNIIVTLILIIIGMALIIASNTPVNINGIDVDAAISTIGSALVIGSLASFFFENHAKEKLFEQVFEKTLKSTEILRAGIQDCHEHSMEINYRQLIADLDLITTLFTYADGFIKRNEQEIIAAAKRGAKIKFLFVDRNSPVIKTMIELGWQEKSIDANYENIEKFRADMEKYNNVSVRYINAIPRYAAVMFDEELFIIEHTTSTKRSQVPAFRISKNGYIGSFYQADINNLIKDLEN